MIICERKIHLENTGNSTLGLNIVQENVEPEGN